jgi:hypothetical protein
MKNILKIGASIAAMLTSGIVHGQNYVKTDLAFSFLGSKKLVQTFDFNLNRTDEVTNKDGGINFFYSPVTNYYITPTVSANIGESITTANNNIVAQVAFGKDIAINKEKGKSFFRISAEISPTYNSDKTFTEKLYYAQIRLILNPIWDKFTGTAASSLLRREFSIAVNPVVNIGSHDSKTYGVRAAYNTAGLNTSFILRYNSLDKKGAVYEDWVFKLTGNGYRLFSEIKALYAKDYYGQLTASIDKALNSKCALSAGYKYGNESAKYDNVNGLTFGFKYKY